MEKLITFTIEMLILPPGGIFILLLAGLVLLSTRVRAGLTLLGTGIVLFYLFSAPFFSAALMGMLEHHAAIVPDGELATEPDAAIVILGGGRIPDAPEFGADTVTGVTLERLRYGARLAKRTGLPVLVSGGTVWKKREPESALMQRALTEDFSVPPRWIESASRTTWENAMHSKTLLENDRIQTVYLVTHAWHMSRAVFAFEQAGFKVIPAPTAFSKSADEDPGFFEIWPNSNSFRRSYFALHELVGLAWYRVKAWL